MRSRLESIALRGFKTINDLAGFKPRPLNVLIGPNGVGKSNFVSFFRMMSWMLADPGNLQLFVSQQGGAGKLLHDGPGVTREIEAELTIQTDVGENQYSYRLVYAAGDTLIFADENYRFFQGHIWLFSSMDSNRRGSSRPGPDRKSHRGHHCSRYTRHPAKNHRLSISQHSGQCPYPRQVGSERQPLFEGRRGQYCPLPLSS